MRWLTANQAALLAARPLGTLLAAHPWRRANKQLARYAASSSITPPEDPSATYPFGRRPNARHRRDPAMIAPRIAPIVNPRRNFAVVLSSFTRGAPDSGRARR